MSESDALDRDRSLWELLTVSAHQLSCPGCRRFRTQTRALGAALFQLRARCESSEKLPGLFLAPDVRERIKAALSSVGGPDPAGPVLPRAPSG
jgi:hypothetical protein